MTGCDIYTVLGLNQPFISSMNTVVNELKQDSIGNGVDIKIAAGFSFQNSLSLARISDKNTYWEEKPQVSYRVLGLPLTFLRVEYDYLHFSEANINYFSPSHWQTISPIIDTSIPLGKYIHLNGTAKSPYVFDASKFGIIVEGGPVVDVGSRLQLGASYLYASIPGRPAHFGQSPAVVRFRLASFLAIAFLAPRETIAWTVAGYIGGSLPASPDYFAIPTRPPFLRCTILHRFAAP